VTSALDAWAVAADELDPPPPPAYQLSPLEFAIRTGRGRYKRAAHLEAMEEFVLGVLAGAGRGLLEVAIRHGKTKFLVAVVAWWLLTHPDQRIIWGSHTANFARRRGREVRDLVNEWGPVLFDGIRVSRTSEAANEWNIAGHAGGMLTVGVGGTPIGEGADGMVIDDPLKSFAAAMSPLQRDGVNDWLTGTMFGRLEPGGWVLMAMARWHADDPGGMVLREDPANWRTLRMPGLCDDPATDPLGRQMGEALWPERYSAEEHAKRRHEMTMTMGDFVWLAQVQQLATPRGGGVFPEDKWGWLRVGEVPAGTRWARGWDLAATEDGGDWTVGTLIGQMPNGQFVVSNVVRGQWTGHKWRTIMRDTAETDPPGTLVKLPQDPGQAGKDQSQQLVSLLAGYNATANPVSGSKEIRANGYAAQQQAGNVHLLEGDWNGAFVAEHTEFPRGVHDDQVDASATGFNELAGVPGIPRYRGALGA
jgi:predicted phage terminase large subunit-like protein